MDRSDALSEDKIPSLLWRFSLPAITGVIVNALYNVIDSIFVGQGVGEIGLVAVTIAFPLMVIIMGIGMFVGLGAATLVSIRLGEKDKDGAELVLGNACTMIVVFMFISTAVALPNLDNLLTLLGATPDVMPYARDFAAIILSGSIFMHLGFGLNGIINAQGDPKTALKTMLIAALLNCLLNPLLIFGLKMGIKGSAWATVLSQAVAAIWVIVYFLRGNGTLNLRLRYLSLRREIILGIAKIGLAPFLMQICTSQVMLIFNFSLLKYGGELAVAIFGIINRILFLTLMPVIGISQGAQPIIGYNYGAGKYDRVLETAKYAVAAATVVCLISFTVIEIFAEPIFGLFSGSQEMIRMGAWGLRLFLMMLPVLGFQIICANYFQAVNQAGYSIVFNLLRQMFLLVPLVYVLPKIWGLAGIWLAEPFSDFGAALLTGLIFSLETKRLKKLNQTAPA